MKINKGFTLIELMITVAIVAILAAIAVPSYQNQIIKSKIKAAQSNLIALSLVVENIYQRTLSYPVLDLADTSEIELEPAFKMWKASSNDFEYAYKATAGDAYTLTATGSQGVPSCTFTLKSDGTRTENGCGSNTGWTN
ncbi:MAG: type IV pilin protein [Venatoribacter sp.]